MATKIVECDALARPDMPGKGWPDYERLMVIFRQGPEILGVEHFPLEDGRVDCASVERAARSLAGERALRNVELRRESAFVAVAAPRISVVVCSRDRAEHLDRCLRALALSDPAPAEILVVDNASSSRATADVAARHGVRCIREPRPGLNWARARGARSAAGEVVAYVDDDVIVTPGWLLPLARSFQDQSLAAVTGLVLPYTLDDEASEMFEQYCGFSRGFLRRSYSLSTFSPMAAANIGAGACMAFRRDIVDELRLFNVELDAGTAARTGGDTYAFYRLISLGYRVEYNPDIIVRHKHRDTEAAVVSTLYDYSLGTYVVYLHCFLRHREVNALSAGLRWFCSHHLRQLARGLLRRHGAPPLRLTLAEVRGCFAAPYAYLRSRRNDRKPYPPAGEAVAAEVSR